jgi:hypothetical protein
MRIGGYSRRFRANGRHGRHCGEGGCVLEVLGVDDVVHVAFVVGVDAAGRIVLPLSVCDKLRGHVSIEQAVEGRMKLSSADCSGGVPMYAPCIEPCP